MLVCRRCEDLPQEQLRSITLPADPVPISNPRVELFATDSTNYMTRTPSTKDPITGLPVLNQTQMSTVGGSPMTGVPVGAPNNARRSMGLDPLAQMKLVNGQVYGVILPVMSVISNGTPIVTVTCSSPHGLSTNAQVGVLGINNPLACGAFSITVTTATAFTYEANFAIPTASLLTSTTIVNTLNVGVPWNYSQIPQTGA